VNFVKNELLILAVSLIAGAAAANEMFASPPNEYLISGSDIYGESAYEIHAIVDYDEGEARLTKLSVKIYDDSITVSSDLLEKIRNPAFGNINVVNDAGVIGSYFYIEIPFGAPFSCSAKSGKMIWKTLNIDNRKSMDGGGLQARVYNKCDYYE
jgi:hypothetical protein